MKFSEKWLRQWVNPDITAEQLAEQLTMAGLEVESVTPCADEFSGVVVGEIIECAKHPDADKLSVCKVDIGDGALHPIVCGGDNVRVGLKIALATVGAVLPGDFKIKKSTLRGEPSHGMICSARELGIEDPVATPKGIMELPGDAPLGVDVRDYLQLDDRIFDVALTPNRGDCASIQGMAREVSVLNRMPIKEQVMNPVVSRCTATIPVRVEDSAMCPRYAGRVIKGIDSHAKTPLAITLRLTQSGIRCIHPVVDVCNYVMLELGQPLHGFDLGKIDSEVIVRRAHDNEQITLLDERTVVLRTSDLVIADKQNALAIAGIMGGFDSGVSAATQDVFLESAFFDPIAIGLTARRLGMVTDASYRFERGVDYALQVHALERATQLLVDISGGQAGPILEIVDQKTLPSAREIVLRRERILSLLGITINDEDVLRILTALQMRVTVEEWGWRVTAPSCRFDVTLDVDLIEEIARIYGYDAIPICDLQAPLKIHEYVGEKVSESRIADLLVDRGYHEVVTYSFVDRELQQRVVPQRQPILVHNPIASDMSAMRTSLWPGLLQTMQYNQNRQASRQKLFEMGLCFWKEGDTVIQEPYLGLLAVGSVVPLQWADVSRPIDFFDLKGDLEMLMGLTRGAMLRFESGTLPQLHPMQSADLFSGEELVGYMGVLHPALTQQLDLRQAPLLLQIKLSAVMPYTKTQYESVSKFPAVRRDLALVVDEAVTVRDIVQVIEDKSGNILTNIQIFDLYQGEAIEKGKKSIALGLTFQDPSRTLVEADINSVIQSIINALTENLKATLRM